MPRFLIALVVWCSIPENRRKVYEVLRLAIPALALTGLIAQAEVELWLGIAQAVLGITAGVLGAANASAAWRWWFYTVTAAVSFLLVFRGLVPADVVSVWLPVLAAALSIVGTTVSIRKVPTSPPEVQAQDGERH